MAVVPEPRTKPVSPQPDPLAGRVVGGFTLDRLIGRGAMAAVYAATDGRGQAIALKMLVGEAARDRELIRRFEREAKVGSAVNHPNLVTVYRAGVDRGIRWLAMHRVDGEALDVHLDRHGAMAWNRAAALVRQVASAVAELHRRGIIHRDLKPGNVLIDKSGTAFVIDLGFAKVPNEPVEHRHDGDNAAELTVTGVAMGSPAYMPPEQVRDAKNVNPAADVYSLAASLFHAVVGHPPFHGGGSIHVMTKVMHDPAPRLNSIQPDAPRGLDALLHCCLNKDPVRRPADATAFMTALDAVIANPQAVPTVAGSGGLWARLKRWFTNK